MADEQKVQQKELTTQEKIVQVNAQLESLSQTENACVEMAKGKNIKIVNLADEGEEPLSLTITGNAVNSIINPIVQGVSANRNQLIALKEQLLSMLESELVSK